MDLLRRRAYARAGLMGNPSDGYHGKTLSIIVRNFHAEVVLYEWEDVEIVLAQEDRSRFRSVDELARDVEPARLLRWHPSGQGDRSRSLWSTAAEGTRCTIATSRFATRPTSRAQSAWPVRAPSSWPRCGR